MIARELLVKLGFDIDERKLSKFSSMVDNVKSKMNSFKKGVYNPYVVDETKVDEKIASLEKERLEFLSLSKEQQKEIIEAKRLEKQATIEVKREERLKYLQEKMIQRERMQRWQQGMITLSRRVAIAGAGIAGAFGLSLRSTLKDAQDQKEGKISKTGNVFSPQQMRSIDSFNRSLKAVSFTMKEIRNGFVVDMLPALNEVLISFRAWMVTNKELLQDKLKEAIQGLSSAFKILLPVITRLIGIIDMVVKSTISWKWLITGLISVGAIAWFAGLAVSIMKAAAAFRVLTFSLLTNPMTAIIVAITAALALLVDEIYVTIKGGDSLINRFLKSEAWVTCKGYVDSIINSFKTLWGWIVKVKDFIFSPGATGLDNLQVKSGVPAAELDFDALKYSPKNISAGFGKTNSNNINQRNNYSISVNVPHGTTQEQSRNIADIVKKEIDKLQEAQYEKFMSVVGSY